MRQLPLAYQHHTDTERAKITRTPAERERLRKRHEVRKEVFVKVMVRDQILTELEAEQQYDSMWRRWS